MPMTVRSQMSKGKSEKEFERLFVREGVSMHARLRLFVQLLLAGGGFICFLGTQTYAQTASQGRPTGESSSQFRVVSVREAPRLELKTGAGFDGGGADAGAGRRYVIVRLEFATEVDSIDNRMLLLVGDDGTLFPSDGLGDEEGKYCAMPGITLKREAEGFRGLCGMTQGGPVSLSWLTPKQPTAAFVVSQSVPLSSLQISYQKKPGVRLK